MGAKIGKAAYVRHSQPFVNLPREALDDLYEQWNDVAEGFGVDKDEASEIFSVLQETLDLPKKPLATLTELLFDVYDTDNNKLNDALEMFGSLAFASGMTMLQKLNYLFTMYNFDESGEFSVDEMTLALRCACVGLAKITDDAPPPESDLEALSHDAMLTYGKSLQSRLTRHEFLDFCRRSHEVRTWVSYYDDAPNGMDIGDAGGDAGGSTHVASPGAALGFSGMTPEDAAVLQIREEGMCIGRTVAEVAALDPAFFLSSDLYSCVVTEMSLCDSAVHQGAADFKASVGVKDRQWVQLLDAVVPSTKYFIKPGPPDYAATLSWVYGYKGRGCRNTLAYTHTNEIAYPAACVGVLFSRERNVQSFLMGHTDEITAIAVHSEPGFTRIATGEMGVRPKVIVWDVSSMQITHSTRGFHVRAITHLCFSPDGTKLVTVGADLSHSVAVYFLLKNGTMQMVFSSMSHRNKVLSAAWLSNERFATAGCRHVYFWDPSEVNSLTVKQKGLFGRAGVHTCVSVSAHPANAQDGAVTGTATGKLLVWKGRNVARILNAHDAAVSVLRCIPSVGLVSGGLDAKVRVWFPDVTPGVVFDLKHLGSLNPVVQSIDWDYPHNKLLIGTGGLEVFEVSDTDGSDLNGGPLMQGHYSGEMHGLAAHPVRDEFVTCGDDGTVRVFDLISRRLLRMTRLAGPARAVCYSPDGTRIAVGMGAPEPVNPYNHWQAAATLGGEPPAASKDTSMAAGTGLAGAGLGGTAGVGGAAGLMAAERPNKNGTFVVLDDMELTIVHEARDSKQWIRCMCWSPDSLTLAVGSADKDTYLYYTADWSSKGKCRGSKYGVSGIDFSVDSVYLRTCCFGNGQDAVPTRGVGGGLGVCGVDAIVALEDLSKARPGDVTRRKKPPAGGAGGKPARGAGASDTKAAPKRAAAVNEGDHPGYQSLFWDSATGEPLRSMAVLKEIDWATSNCVLSWETQGSWPGCGKGEGEGTDPASIPGGPLDRGMVPTIVSAIEAKSYANRFLEVRATARSYGGDTIAALDEYGRLRLARFPWISDAMPCHELRGHSTSPARAAFTSGDGFIVTIGARDRCAFQWSLELLPSEHTATRSAAAAGGAGAGKGRVGAPVLEDERGDGEEGEEDDADSIDEEMARKDEELVRDNATEAIRSVDMLAQFALQNLAHRGKGLDPIASKSWANASVPPSEPPPLTLAPPPENLRLEWIHGYRAQDCRNNVRYNNKLEIMFPAGAVMVCMKLSDSGAVVQRHFLEHTDDILCCNIHPTGRMAVSGQVGRCPKLLVWDTHTLVTTSQLLGHFGGVSHCAFSPVVEGMGEGRYVASVGLDTHHSVLVHDWKSGDVIASIKGAAGKTLDLSWSPQGDVIVVCGLRHCSFYTLDGTNLTNRPAVMGSKGVLGRMMCIAWAGPDACVIGTGTGKLYKFKEHQLQQVFNAHTGAITCCHTSRSGIVTGGRDGTVKLWTTGIDMQRSFDISGLERCLVPSLRSVCCDTASNRIVLGTAGSEIYEISSLNGMDVNSGPLVQGHFQGQVWGLDTHPTKSECVTVGDDQTVRVWSLSTRALVGSTDIDAAGRAIAYSPDAIRLAVGLGGKPLPASQKVKLDGGFLILDARDLSVVHEGRDSKEWISEIKYSPDGTTLACGSRDGKVYLYDVAGAYSVKGIFSQHHSHITAFDFSVDSGYLQSNDGAFELLFSNDGGEYLAQATALKDVSWATQSCTLGWGVKGLWPKVNDGTVYTAADRSNEGSALVAGDNYGRLKLVPYPCPDPDCLPKGYSAHAHGITRIRWAANDTHVVTLGGKDRCVCVWRVVRDADEESTPTGKEGADPDIVDEFSGIPEDREGGGDGGEFDAVKPWVAASVAPSRPVKPHPSPPDETPVIDWVHGFRTDCRGGLAYNQKGDIVYSAASLGVIYQPSKHAQDYYKGHNGIDVGSIAMDSRGRFAASGEITPRPRVHIWDSVSGLPVIRLSFLHRKGVCVLSFSPGPRVVWKAALPSIVGLVEKEGVTSKAPAAAAAKAKPGPAAVLAATGGAGGEGPAEGASGAVDDEVLIGKGGVIGAGLADGARNSDGIGWDEGGCRLVTVGCDSDHTVAVWVSADGTWADGKLVAFAPSSKEKVLFAAFIGSTSNKPCDLITGGVKHVTFWQISGRIMVPYNGVFGKKGRIQPVVSCCVYDNKVITGTATGHLYVWTDRTVTRAISAHERTVNSLHSTGDFMVSGSKDGTVKVWGKGSDIALLSQFDLATARPLPMNSSIRSVRLSVDKLRSTILIGTKSSDIYELRRLTGACVQVSSAHAVDEVWGLAPHPTNADVYISCGDDKTIRLWSVSKKRQLAAVVHENTMRAVSWSPDGTMVAVGYGGRAGPGRSRRDGAFALLNSSDLSVLHEGQDCRDWVCEIKFAPDSSLMALASQDSKIYVYTLAVRRAGGVDIRLASKCEMSNAPVRHFDIDFSSKFLQACDLQGELVMYSIEDGERVTHPSELKDVEWANFSSIYGYTMLGAWPESGNDVTSAHRSSSRLLMATGEETGRVKLFRAPVIMKKQAHYVVYGHSAPVTKARFTCNDSRLLTCGRDKAIIQWRLEKAL